jgi:hypothetical protein
MDDTIEVIPGTEFMKYEDEVHLAVKTGTGRMRDLVLVPQPSNNPHDPLVYSPWYHVLQEQSILTRLIQNWSRGWKLAAVANQAFFCLVSLLLPLSIAPLTPILVKEFNKSVSDIALLVCFHLKESMKIELSANSQFYADWIGHH